LGQTADPNGAVGVSYRGLADTYEPAMCERPARGLREPYERPQIQAPRDVFADLAATPADGAETDRFAPVPLLVVRCG